MAVPQEAVVAVPQEAVVAAPQEAAAAAGERSDLKPHSRDRWRAQESAWRQERVLE